MHAEEMGGVPHQLVRYVARFDRREYWLAHEELEELWLVDRRDIFKGLIQIAAGFLHIERENWRGAQRLLTTALRYLSAVPDRCEGLDIATVRSLTAAALELATRLVDGEESAFDESLKFSLAPLFDGKMTEVIIEDAELPYRVRRYDEGYRATSKSGADRQRRSAPEVPPTGSAGGSR